MTIQGIIDKINEYDTVTIESGLIRDIEGYLASLTQQQNKTNMALLKDINQKMVDILKPIYNSDYDEQFQFLFPTEDLRPFTERDYLNELSEIQNDSTLQVTQIWSQLNTLLTQLKQQINLGATALNTLKEQIEPFTIKSEIDLSEANKAIISIDFKNEDTIGNLKNFSGTLNKWNRTLTIYHSLLSSESPEDIILVDVENGSINIILDLEIDLASNLLAIFNTGLTAFMAYLAWKANRISLAQSYQGNPKLLKLDEQYKQELIKNVENAVLTKLQEQHTEHQKNDKDLKSEGIDIKLSEISKLLQEHIVKGNDIRLIAAPEDEEELKEKNEETKKLSKKIRKDLKNLPKGELIKLIGEFIPPEEIKKRTTKK